MAEIFKTVIESTKYNDYQTSGGQIHMIRFRLLITYLSQFLVIAQAGADELAWLQGCWDSSDKQSREVWVTESRQAMAGFSVALSDGKISFYEVLTIMRNDRGTLVYTAHPAGQHQVSFIATEVLKTSVTFANPEHDYPQQIRYRRHGDRLVATISLLGGENPNAFHKTRCE